MIRIPRFLLAALIAVVMVLAATPAFAATSLKSVDVTVHMEQQQALLLVSGEVPADAKLPYETELAVPAGMQLSWIGEILGGDPAQDPKLTYTKTSANGMDIYRFTLTKSRTAQIEGSMPGIAGFDGKNYTSAIKWTAWQDVPEVYINQRIPSGATVVVPSEGATTQPGPTGYQYYGKALSDVKAGQVVDLSFAYALPSGAAPDAPGAAPAAASSGNSNVPLVIILLVAAVGFIVLAMRVNSKMGAKSGDADEDENGAEDYDDEVDEVEIADSLTAFEEDEPAAEEPFAKPAKKAAPKKSTNTASQRSSAQTKVVEPERVTAPRNKLPLIIVGVVAGALIIAGFVAGNNATSTEVVGGKITKEFGAASPCTPASIAIVPKPGVDLNKQGGELVDAFTGQKEIGTVTLDIARNVVDVTFCESYQTEDSIRAILTGTGLVDAPKTAGAAPSGATTGTPAPPAQ